VANDLFRVDEMMRGYDDVESVAWSVVVLLCGWGVVLLVGVGFFWEIGC